MQLSLISWYQVIIFFASEGLDEFRKYGSRPKERVAIYAPQSK